ncbi:hypothetical protein PM082_011384 [Marasmius tenuissimus]|nr:hypothetical protein PM082_011384 [Marasmius tenuissimus]
MANFQLATQTSNYTFYGFVSQNFHQILRPYGGATVEILDDCYAAIRWYKARPDEPYFLQIARMQWERAYRLTISEEAISNRTMAAKGFPVCRGTNNTFDGATFVNDTLDDGGFSNYESRQVPVCVVSINLISQYYYQPHGFKMLTLALTARVSALLAEAEPSETKYVKAFSLSLDFALPWAAIFRYSGRVLPHSPPLSTGCDEKMLLMPLPSRSAVGFLIEAMSIMHNVTGDEDMGKKLKHAVNSTLISLGARDTTELNSDGVLPNSNHGDMRYSGDMLFLRSLAEAYRRSERTLSAELRDNIKVLLGVHYNAVRELATTGDGVYSQSWRGLPTPTTFDLYNQAAAAQILVDGISLFNSNDISGPTTISPESPSSQPGSTSKPTSAVIAGVTVGSVIGVALIVLIIVYIVRRWRRKYRTAPSSESGSLAQVIEPFVTTTFEKRVAFPHKQPSHELHTRVIVPETRPAQLRRHNSAPSALQEARDSLGQSRDMPGSFNIRISGGTNGTIYPEHTQAGGDIETSLTTPDLVRALYQRLWQNGSENPPDYRSDLGESQGDRDIVY